LSDEVVRICIDDVKALFDNVLKLLLSEARSTASSIRAKIIGERSIKVTAAKSGQNECVTGKACGGIKYRWRDT